MSSLPIIVIAILRGGSTFLDRVGSYWMPRSNARSAPMERCKHGCSCLTRTRSPAFVLRLRLRLRDEYEPPTNSTPRLHLRDSRRANRRRLGPRRSNHGEVRPPNRRSRERPRLPEMSSRLYHRAQITDLVSLLRYKHLKLCVSLCRCRPSNFGVSCGNSLQKLNSGELSYTDGI